MLKRIAITGPESTGKSTLAESLAKHYHTLWIPEYARGYIDQLKREYNQEDILIIAQQQLLQEEAAAKRAHDFLFLDTEFLVTKIWSEVKYKSCHPWITKQYHEHIYDLYLLCNVDLPWEEDPQREHPHLRQYLYDLYYNDLTSSKLPFSVVSGTGEERLENAVNLIETIR